jgi:hypothetical protein
VGRVVSSDELPLDVQSLLRERLRGLEHLELLLLLRRSAPHAWTASSIAAQASWPERWVADALEDLREAELIVMDARETERRFTYSPATTALDAAVAILAQIYAERRAEVIQTLNDHAVGRIRSAALRAFTDVLRKKDG